ncbi:helix-turn-helix domain-containing protein [Haliscomenobacter sp.]|uniref:helix-turn-helix domain-containing protein n=1 Tax=Haliscomenobacter sp. TaxID=2717303 RepID=UPI003BAB5C6F
MSFEDTMRAIISEQVEPLKKALQDALNAKSKGAEDDVWLKVGQAAKLLGCDSKHVQKLIDMGFLSLAFLPGTDRGDRRISRKEIEELKEKYTILERSRK